MVILISVHVSHYPKDTFPKVSSGYFHLCAICGMVMASRKEGCVLKSLVEAVLENMSTKDVFIFRVSCGICETEYGNKPVRFSKAGMIPPDKNKQIIFEVLYEQEFRAARQAAIRNATEHMNYCPICKRLVCNQCFLICEDLDMCRQCAIALEQTGNPVLSDVIDEAI